MPLCLCSRQVRNQNSLGVLCAPCKEYAAVPLLQTFQVRNQVSLIPLSTASCNCTMMQRVCLFRPVVRYLCNAFRCMNRSPLTPLFTVFSSCHIVKFGNKSHGHLSTLGIRFANTPPLFSESRSSSSSLIMFTVSVLSVLFSASLSVSVSVSFSVSVSVSFSCYVCMFCGILDCFGLFWIVLDFGFKCSIGREGLF